MPRLPVLEVHSGDPKDPHLREPSDSKTSFSGTGVEGLPEDQADYGQKFHTVHSPTDHTKKVKLPKDDEDSSADPKPKRQISPDGKRRHCTRRRRISSRSPHMTAQQEPKRGSFPGKNLHHFPEQSTADSIEFSFNPEQKLAGAHLRNHAATEQSKGAAPSPSELFRRRQEYSRVVPLPVLRRHSICRFSPDLHLSSRHNLIGPDASKKRQMTQGELGNLKRRGDSYQDSDHLQESSMAPSGSQSFPTESGSMRMSERSASLSHGSFPPRRLSSFVGWATGTHPVLTPSLLDTRHSFFHTLERLSPSGSGRLASSWKVTGGPVKISRLEAKQKQMRDLYSQCKAELAKRTDHSVPPEIPATKEDTPPDPERQDSCDHLLATVQALYSTEMDQSSFIDHSRLPQMYLHLFHVQKVPMTQENLKNFMHDLSVAALEEVDMTFQMQNVISQQL